MNAQENVIKNQDLFALIAEYVGDKNMNMLFKNCMRPMHKVYLKINTLVYGQVQSGKTGRIMEYIKYYQTQFIKILVVQNNLSMVSQYCEAFNKNDINYHVITNKSINDCASEIKTNDINVVIVMCNKYRLEAIDALLTNNCISYNLILDESDQYYFSPKFTESKLANGAFQTLHVTATPFVYKQKIEKDKFKFDNVIQLKAKENYIGLQNINIQVNLTDENIVYTLDKIEADFISKPHGFMLINWASTIVDMNNVAQTISNIHDDIPVVVLSSNQSIYLNGNKTVLKINKLNMQKFIDKFELHSHIIFIANRYSNRGINFTNSKYTRSITHQISRFENDKTNFIQKCRIFGNKNLDYTPTMYVITSGMSKLNKLKAMVCDIKKALKKDKQEEQEQVADTDILYDDMTVKQLKEYCKQRSIRGYSKLRKADIIDLIVSHEANIQRVEEDHI